MIALNTALFAILLFIALVILHQLIIAKNGKLRKIMIGYFSAESIGLLLLIIWEIGWGGESRYTTQLLLFSIYAPKVIPKLFFYFYIRNR